MLAQNIVFTLTKQKGLLNWKIVNLNKADSSFIWIERILFWIQLPNIVLLMEFMD